MCSCCSHVATIDFAKKVAKTFASWGDNTRKDFWYIQKTNKRFRERSWLACCHLQSCLKVNTRPYICVNCCIFLPLVTRDANAVNEKGNDFVERVREKLVGNEEVSFAIIFRELLLPHCSYEHTHPSSCFFSLFIFLRNKTQQLRIDDRNVVKNLSSILKNNTSNAKQRNYLVLDLSQRTLTVHEAFKQVLREMKEVRS